MLEFQKTKLHMHIDKQMLRPYRNGIIALGLTIGVFTILGMVSYFSTDTLQSFFVKSLVAACIITIIWQGAMYPTKTDGLVPCRVFLKRAGVGFILFIFMTFLAVGIYLSGKVLHQKHHPESFVPIGAKDFYFSNKHAMICEIKKIPMKKRKDPKYDPKTRKATFAFSIPTIEIRGDAAGKYNYGEGFVKNLPPKNKSTPHKKK